MSDLERNFNKSRKRSHFDQEVIDDQDGEERRENLKRRRTRQGQLRFHPSSLPIPFFASTHDSITTEEVEQDRSRSLNLPRSCSPSSQDGRDERSSLDIYVFREEESEIVGTGDGVGGDVCT